MNYRMIKYTLGWLLLFETGFLLVPLITALIYREQAATSILISMAITALVSGHRYVYRLWYGRTLPAEDRIPERSSLSEGHTKRY